MPTIEEIAAAAAALRGTPEEAAAIKAAQDTILFGDGTSETSGTSTASDRHGDGDCDKSTEYPSLHSAGNADADMVGRGENPRRAASTSPPARQRSRSRGHSFERRRSPVRSSAELHPLQAMHQRATVERVAHGRFTRDEEMYYDMYKFMQSCVTIVRSMGWYMKFVQVVVASGLLTSIYFLVLYFPPATPANTTFCLVLSPYFFFSPFHNIWVIRNTRVLV